MERRAVVGQCVGRYKGGEKCFGRGCVWGGKQVDRLAVEEVFMGVQRSAGVDCGRGVCVSGGQSSVGGEDCGRA